MSNVLHLGRNRGPDALSPERARANTFPHPLRWGLAWTCGAAVEPEPDQPAGFLWNLQVINRLAGTEVADGEDLAWLDASQILPNTGEDGIDLAEDHLFGNVSERIPG